MTEIDKEAFRAAIVHDMRAPLNACLMSLSLIELKASQTAEVMKSVEVIRRNLERQAILIDDLGDALQILAEGLELDTEKVELASLTRTAAGSIRPSIGIELAWAGPPSAVSVVADPERLGRAIGTVLEVIASEAGAEDRVVLELREEEGSARIEVRRAQPPDARAAARRKRPVMRLTVADAIVARHGGRLELEADRAAIVLPRAA